MLQPPYPLAASIRTDKESIAGLDDPPDDSSVPLAEPAPDDSSLLPPAPPVTSLPHPIVGERGGTTRSGRQIKDTQRSQESQFQRGKKWVSWLVLCLLSTQLSPQDEIYELFAHCEYDIQDRAARPFAFSASSDPDMM
jgi:hypothetical protein